MPLIVRLHSIFRRLRTRFDIAETGEQESTIIPQMIQPITNVDNLLATVKAERGTEDISATAGGYVAYFTVPTGKKWVVSQFYRQTTTANTQIRANISGQAVQLGLLGTTNEIVRNFGLALEENDSIGLRTTGNGADSAITADIVYEEEDAF